MSIEKQWMSPGFGEPGHESVLVDPWRSDENWTIKPVLGIGNP